MASVSVIKLKVRRGSDYERRQITLDVGELGYVSDVAARRIFVGDGSTKGGNPAGIKFYTADINNPDPALQTCQVGDIIFNTSDNRLYSLSGYNLQNFPNYSVPTAYQFIGTRTDNASLEYHPNGSIKVKDGAAPGSPSQSGISWWHMDASSFGSAFDLNGGLQRTGNGPVSVKVDNVAIKIISGSVTLDQGQINFGSINTNNQGIDASNLAFNFLPGSPWTLGTNKLWRDSNGYLRVS